MSSDPSKPAGHSPRQSVPDLAAASPAADPLVVQARQFVDHLLERAAAQQAAGRDEVEHLGHLEQAELARRSAMLKEPLRALAGRAEDGGDVAQALLALRDRVEELDPARFDLEPGFATRLIGYIPGIGTPLKRYFSRYESVSTVIDRILQSLRAGKEQLRRDNLTLQGDQEEMHALAERLEHSIGLSRLVDAELEQRLATQIEPDTAQARFVAEELLFPLRQRIQDMQQQLLVGQQGYLTTEVIVRNNRELMRGVDRAVNVTVNALQTAVALALALANQKIVLDKVQTITDTTNKLIGATAARLKSQGVDIHRQAAATQLDLEVLRKAFSDVRAALDALASFRRAALPEMAKSILEMDRIAVAAAGSVRALQQGNAAADDWHTPDQNGA
ncbi:MAG: Toxic anion resistance protein (TelA) [Candidatus Accumulibacter phosphatis]|uniref:Toxic anion resistance protein (TelA) n=1 Tax=Candidatus Accumulibacter phosphatis TaxID=327160 RepID=A0A080LY35_9PROT|nr:toxic anion resistance protein [Accumulibacter sp.]KFB73621.1 MAG: Toxic anion resistance protein (TelA) [Candidatus Accumulibacter phosphatis]HRF13187.1 toxic anion resistance protein [Candidatus Accumulibacter phosphatis]